MTTKAKTRLSNHLRGILTTSGASAGGISNLPTRDATGPPNISSDGVPEMQTRSNAIAVTSDRWWQSVQYTEAVGATRSSWLSGFQGARTVGSCPTLPADRVMVLLTEQVYTSPRERTGERLYTDPFICVCIAEDRDESPSTKGHHSPARRTNHLFVGRDW